MISRGSSCVPQKKPLLLKPYSEIYRQRHLKHFPYRQGINISVTLSVQLHWHWPFKKTHYPSKSTTTLAIWTLCWFRILAKLWAFNFGHPCPSLVKGRWIDDKAQTLTLLHLLVICPPFLCCKLFCRQDGGIATPTAPFPFLWHLR